MNKYLITLSLGLLLAGASCNKSKDAASVTTPASADTFSATPSMIGTKDGNAWTAASGLYAVFMSSQKPSYFILEGMQTNTDIISITIYNYKGGPGTYDLGRTAQQGYAYNAATKNPSPQEYAPTGTINIVRVLPDSTMQGTYEFANNSNIVFRGKFTVKPTYH